MEEGGWVIGPGPLPGPIENALLNTFHYAHQVPGTRGR